MRKMSIGIACVAVLVAVSMASAGTINLWTATTCVATHQPGADLPAFNTAPGNATCRVAPTDQVARLSTRPAFLPLPAGGLTYDRNSIYIMADEQCRADGVGNEVMSSLGLDIHKVFLQGDVSQTNALSATGFSTLTVGTGAASGPWSGTAAPTLNAAGNLLIQNSRAVDVPSSTTDALWNGYSPNRDSAGGNTNTGCGTGGRFNVGGVNGSYVVAKLDVAAGSVGADTRGQNFPAGPGTASFNLFMRVGSLKITRVYDPTATNGGAPENVSFGYNGAVPDAALSGSVPGVDSANPDAVVVIRRKGDFASVDGNGNPQNVPDNQVGSADINPFLATIGQVGDTLNVWLCDFGGADGNGNPQPIQDCQCGSVDINYFLNSFNS